MLSVVIPSHNEERRIGPTLERLASFLQKKSRKLGVWSSFEVILVDDSSDATVRVAKKAASRRGVKLKLVSFPSRRGKGFAVRAGITKARGDVLLYDADGSTPPQQILRLKKALDEGADVAIGSRFAPGASASGQPLKRRIAGRCFNFLARTLLGLSFRDTQCGFKAMRKSVAKKLAPLTKSNGYSWDLEMILRAVENGFSVREVGIEWRHSPKGNINSLPLHTTLELGSDLLRFKLAK